MTYVAIFVMSPVTILFYWLGLEVHFGYLTHFILFCKKISRPPLQALRWERPSYLEMRPLMTQTGFEEVLSRLNRIESRGPLVHHLCVGWGHREHHRRPRNSRCVTEAVAKS